MKLSEVPFNDLKVGDKLISATGKNGKITSLWPEDENSILMEWEGVVESENQYKESYGFHHQCDSVTYIGR